LCRELDVQARKEPKKLIKFFVVTLIPAYLSLCSLTSAWCCAKENADVKEKEEQLEFTKIP
jgi:hypothetical protein